MNNIKFKKCTGPCERILEENSNNFSYRNKIKCIFGSLCKLCAKKYNKQYREKNHFKILAKKSKYRKNNKKIINQKATAYYGTNKKIISKKKKNILSKK